MLVLDTVVLCGAVLSAKHGLFAAECSCTSETSRSREAYFGGGMSMFFEKGTKLGGIYLWVHVSGHPEEVEGVIGCRCGIGSQGVFVRVGVAARVVAGCPIALLSCSSLGTGCWEIRIMNESARAALESGASFYITNVFDLTLDLVVGRLHDCWRCLHERERRDVLSSCRTRNEKVAIGKGKREKKERDAADDVASSITVTTSGPTLPNTAMTLNIFLF